MGDIEMREYKGRQKVIDGSERDVRRIKQRDLLAFTTPPWEYSTPFGQSHHSTGIFDTMWPLTTPR
jgi:hypothetical protein